MKLLNSDEVCHWFDLGQCKYIWLCSLETEWWWNAAYALYVGVIALQAGVCVFTKAFVEIYILIIATLSLQIIELCKIMEQTRIY